MSSLEIDLASLDLHGLAAAFGTPLYLYDLDVVTARVAALRAALPDRFELAYAMKANPSLGLVARIGELGAGIDVASGGELEAAICAGVDPAGIVFTGPGKREDELEAAVRAGVRAVTVESLGELRRLAATAERLGRRQAVLLRARAVTSQGSETLRIVGDDGAGKFGMGDGELRIAAAAAVDTTHLDLLGIHSFCSSNVLDAGALAGHVDATVDRARTLAGLIGFELRVVDVGGGLGIPYADDERSLDLDDLRRRFDALAKGWRADPALKGLSVLVEPGRYLVGPAGVYLARVVDVKSGGSDPLGQAPPTADPPAKTPGPKVVAIVDGGIHHMVRPALVGREHRVTLVPADGRRFDDVADVTVAGPLCSGLDILARSTRLAMPNVGDLVAVLDAGAYGYTESMPLFLSHPMPAEIGIRGGEARVLRRRIDPREWLAPQVVPDWRDMAAPPDPSGADARGRAFGRPAPAAARPGSVSATVSG